MESTGTSACELLRPLSLGCIRDGLKGAINDVVEYSPGLQFATDGRPGQALDLMPCMHPSMSEGLVIDVPKGTEALKQRIANVVRNPLRTQVLAELRLSAWCRRELAQQDEPGKGNRVGFRILHKVPGL
jgi:hypothetical protein